MPIDPYSLCPGGSGKKVKFCCGDLLNDLNLLDKMIEGEQHTAALERIDYLLESHAGNESLLAQKTRLLRLLGRLDEAKAAAETFLAAHPKNPVALAESAIVTAMVGNGRGGMAKLQEALAVSGKELYGRVYETMSIVAAALLHEGDVCACRALLQMQTMIAGDDEEPLRYLVQINASPTIPLLLKQDRLFKQCPADAAWQTQFSEAMAPLQLGHWTAVAERLASLAAEHPSEPSLWQNLAVLRDWLADAEGSVAALRKLVELDIPAEDAVEAEALALLRSPDGFGDEHDVFELEYEVNDIDELAAAFSICNRAQQVPVDYRSEDENDVPPKSMFVLVDRPAADSAEDLKPEDVSQVIARAMLFGRQTDRAAQLVITDVSEHNLDSLESLVKEVGGEQTAQEPRRETLGRESATQDLLRRPWQLPRDITKEQLHDLMKRHVEYAILQQWPAMNLGCLDGKTPRQAAADPALSRRVAALVLVLETTLDAVAGDFDFNRLRTELGLPALGPIDPASWKLDDQQAVDGQTSIISTLPLVRLPRLEVEKLSDELLVEGYRRCVAFHVDRAMQKFGEEILRRPSFRGKDEENDVLYRLARSVADIDKRLDYIRRGRENALAAVKSCAIWDILELPLRLEKEQIEEIERLISHIRNKHMKEPGVAEAMYEFFVRIGALRPNGMPGNMGDEAMQPAAAAADAQPGKLWTPNGEQSGGEKPSLWVPGMD